MRLNRVRGAVLLSVVVTSSCAGSGDGDPGSIDTPETASAGGSAGAPLASAGAAGVGTSSGAGGATGAGGSSSSVAGAGGANAGGTASRDAGAEAMACKSTCTQDGALQCVDASSFQRCSATAGACLGWSAATACPMGQVCSAGQCGAARTCKRGVAYNFDNASVSADVPALKSVSWFYNWTAAISSQVSGVVVPAGVEFVPMVWGKNINVDTIANGIPAGAKYLLGFNEPNMGVPQSNLTPAQAAALWPQVEQIAQRKNLKIVSPAVNFCGSPCNVQDPVSWMDQFLAACTNCKVDHIAIHWYACTGSALKMYVRASRSTISRSG